VTPQPVPGARLLFSLDPGVAYLNHGAFGAVPIPVQRTQQRLRDEMESNPQKFFTAGLLDRVEHARRHIAAFLGADPDGTAFVANATAGVSLVVGSLRLEAGAEVVTTTHGYGAVDIALDRACTAARATHTRIPVPLTATDDEIVAAFTAALRPGRTRFALVDYITSPTARVMPVHRLVTAARERGVPIMVDGAHAPGAQPVHVDALGADYWVGNLHKWLFAPRPAALLNVAPKWREQIAPRVVSWHDLDGYPANVEMQGTLDYTAWLAAPAGLYLMRSLGVDSVRSHNAALVSYGQSVVGAALGLLASADLPDPGAPEACMRVLPLPTGIGSDLQSANALRIRIADELRVIVPITPWEGQGLLRLSAQVYNTPDEYDRLATGLPRVLKSMR
jgi:isopenicillin-N epimerase